MFKFNYLGKIVFKYNQLKLTFNIATSKDLDHVILKPLIASACIMHKAKTEYCIF